jgi:CBS domain-containing membrane protein
VIGGSMVSGLIGLLLVRSGMALPWSIGTAVASSVLAMFFLRCLHPPAGALALWVVLTQTHAFEFLLFPLLFNLVLLVLAAVAYNTLTGRAYPHLLEASVSAPQPSRFSAADLDAALAHYNQVLDVSRDDLEKLLTDAEAAAYQRNLGELRCVDIMSAQPIAVSYDTAINDAWALMRSKSIKALPVVDGSNHISGIVTLADFVRDKEALVEVPILQTESARPVADIMTRRVRVASASSHVVALLPLFSEGGHHHIPVVNETRQLVGIITQSDLIRALNRAVQPTT